MLAHVPASLDGLLLLFRSCFSQPTFQTFRAMVVGQVSQTSLRTVTGMLVGARLSGVWHHARAHRFFSYARWSVEELGLRVCDLIVERLLGPGAPLIVPIDDTLLRRRGRKVHATFWHHDATANSRSGAVAWGNNWVTAGINVKLAFCERSVCLLVIFRLWRPRRKEIAKGKPDPLRPSKPRLAREMLCLLAKRFTGRMIHMVGDAAYASGAFAGLPANVTITSRLRADATLNELPAPRPPEGQRKRGRPPKKGPRLGKHKQIALDPATEWVNTTVGRYSKTEQVMVHAFRCLWYEAFGSQPVQVVIVQDTTKPSGYQLALISTDPKATAAQLIERYADRWPTEVAYEEGKELFGVGEARNRAEKAVQRTVPFQFLAMSLTIIWYALSGHTPGDVAEHRQRAPWYATKTTPSFADMQAKLRRVMPGGRGGISPPGSHRSGREPLDSSGSCHSTSGKHRRSSRAPMAHPAARLSIWLWRVLAAHPASAVGHQARLSDPPPSLQPHYRAFNATTGRSAPVLRNRYSAPRGFSRLGASFSRPGSPLPATVAVSERQVPEFRMDARARLAPPIRALLAGW